ncbi:MAG: hypothetical protein FGM47_04040 [Candidatus Nanopelagicaceae bacterium]|nr:hypothetical protein [Candidatus Nanopelagicaceae bacterium]
MKKIAIILSALLFLTACGNDPEVTTAPELPSVPSDCNKTKILAAFPEKVQNPKFIDTQWEPAEGTDLYAAYNAGGIACSYGIQEAEIGATILWAPDNQILFNERSTQWIADGQKAVDLPDFDEEKAYVLTQGTEGQGEFMVWSINYLIDGVWIQLGATFLGSIEEAMPLVKAAADSLRTPKQAARSNLKGCFMAELPEDLYVFNIDYHDNNTLSAGFYTKKIDQDAQKGIFVGSYTNGVVQGFYTIDSEQNKKDHEFFLKGDKTGFTLGTGKTTTANGVEKFQRPLDIKWDEKIKYIPAEDCEALLRG